MRVTLSRHSNAGSNDRHLGDALDGAAMNLDYAGVTQSNALDGLIDGRLSGHGRELRRDDHRPLTAIDSGAGGMAVRRREARW